MLGELSTLTRDLLLRKTAPEGGAALLSGGFDSATLDRLGKRRSRQPVFVSGLHSAKGGGAISITAPTGAPTRSCACCGCATRACAAT